MWNWLAGMNGIAADMLFSGGYLVAPRHADDAERAHSGDVATPVPPTLSARSPDGSPPGSAPPRISARLAAG